MRSSYLLAIFSLVLATGINACGFSKRISEIAYSFEKHNENSIPIVLTLSQALIVQDKLLIRARVEILAPLQTDEIVIGAVGLRDGVLTEEAYVQLSTLTDAKYTAPPSSYIISFELLRSEISEFQLKCSWGDAARSLLSEKLLLDELDMLDNTQANTITSKISNKKQDVDIIETPPIITPSPSSVMDSLDKVIQSQAVLEVEDNKIHRPLQIKNLRLNAENNPCDKKHCPAKLSMVGTLENEGQEPIHEITLAFGLFWSADGQVPELPSDLDPKSPGEKVLSFGASVLIPRDHLPFKISIGEEPVDIPGGDFLPHLRVLKYKVGYHALPAVAP